MKKLFMVGIVVMALIGMTIPVFAGNPHNPYNPPAPMSVKGSATTISLSGYGTRITTIDARITPDGVENAATGTVQVNAWSPFTVLNLKFEGNWAYLIMYGANPNPEDYPGDWYWYLVVYNGSNGKSDKDMVSACYTADTIDHGYKTVHAYFDAGWKTNELWEGTPGQPLLTVIKGGFNFTP